MATLSQAEQRGAIDGIFRACGEDYNRAAVILFYLRTVLPTFTWDSLLTSRALLWQPYIDDGLSIAWWTGETIRLSNTLGG
jgi:hypothetical protein